MYFHKIFLVFKPNFDICFRNKPTPEENVKNTCCSLASYLPTSDFLYVDHFFTIEVPQHNTLGAHISVRTEVKWTIFGKYLVNTQS